MRFKEMPQSKEKACNVHVRKCNVHVRKGR